MLMCFQCAMVVAAGFGVTALVWGCMVHDQYIHDSGFGPSWQQGFWTGVMGCGFFQAAISLILLGLTQIL